jgi:hypothetical protein
MQTMTLHMRDGDVVFHCTGCARDFYVDATKPFVPQLREISYGHHCYAEVGHDELAEAFSSLIDS